MSDTDEKEMKETFAEYLKEIQKIAAEEGFEDLDETYVEHLRCRFYGEPVVIGTSKRVRLRELSILDLEALYQFPDARQEPVLKALLKEDEKSSREYLEAYISHTYPFYDYGIYGAELLENGELIGLCGLGQVKIYGEECTDLGYYISPKWRRQGLAKECVEIVLDYAKNYLEFPVIYAIIKEENRISKEVLCAFDFELIGRGNENGESGLIFQKEFKKAEKAHEGERQ